MNSMDLNNKMVMMRKDIRNAKSFVIQKLVRKIHGLQKKKGTELQMQKNTNRSNNLLKEIDILKDLPADKIFKYLLSSDATLDDIGKQNNVNLNERCCVRVGTVPFINKRMNAIKEEVANFDSIRSHKKEITSIKITKQLTDLHRFNTNMNDQNAPTPDLTLTNNHSKSDNTIEPNSQNSNHENFNQSKKDLPEQLPKKKTSSNKLNKDSAERTLRKSDSCDSDQSSNAISNDNFQDIPGHKLDSKKTNQVMSKSQIIKNSSTLTNHCNLSDSNCSSDEDISDIESMDTESRISDQVDFSYSGESDQDSNAEVKEIEVVLPDFYKNSNDLNNSDSNTNSIKTVTTSTDHVTDVLSNIGAGFADSDEEAQAVRMNRWANMESDDDDFFVLDGSNFISQRNPRSTEQLKRLYESNPIVPSTRDYDEGPPRPSYWSNLPDKRSRPDENYSQKKTLSKTNFKSQYQKTNLPSHGKSVKEKKTLNKTPDDPQHLHPSWQASKKKKQHNKIVEYTGTRITFDD